MHLIYKYPEHTVQQRKKEKNTKYQKLHLFKQNNLNLAPDVSPSIDVYVKMT